MTNHHTLLQDADSLLETLWAFFCFCRPFVFDRPSSLSSLLAPLRKCSSRLAQIRDLILKLDHVARQNDVVHFPRLALAAKGGWGLGGGGYMGGLFPCHRHRRRRGVFCCC